MTLRARKILFYLITVFFFAIAIPAIFYSNGWRFDIETFSISKLGGIYFEEIPDGSVLTVEKAAIEFNPNFLRSSLLIPNLFPKNYYAMASRKNYQPWTKEIPVYPSLVTEIQPVILLPEKPSLGNPLAKNIADFWEKSGKIILATKSKELFFRQSRISGTELVSWSDDADAVLTKDGENFYLIYLANPKSALNISLMFYNARKTKIGSKDRMAIEDASFRSDSAGMILIRTDGGLYSLDSESSALSVISSKSAYAYAAGDSELIFADSSGLFSHSSGKTATLTPSIPIEDPTGIIFNDAYTYFLLKNGSGDLLLVDRNTMEAELLAKNAKTAFFAAGHLKLAFTTFNNELVIYTFGKKYQILDKPKTEILRLSIADDSSLAWHKDAAHIFMQYPDTAYLLEANELPPINLQIIENGADKFQYDRENEELYLMKKSDLYKMKI